MLRQVLLYQVHIFIEYIYWVVVCCCITVLPPKKALLTRCCGSAPLNDALGEVSAVLTSAAVPLGSSGEVPGEAACGAGGLLVRVSEGTCRGGERCGGCEGACGSTPPLRVCGEGGGYPVMWKPFPSQKSRG